MYQWFHEMAEATAVGMGESRLSKTKLLRELEARGVETVLNHALQNVKAMESSGLMCTNLPEYGMFLQAQIRVLTELDCKVEQKGNIRQMLLQPCARLGSMAQA